MCGRYRQTSGFATLAEVFGIDIMPDYRPAGVIAPGMRAPVIADGGLSFMTWGLVPHWSKEDLKTKIINARLETLAEKPSFRDAGRCLIPADGFFEWDKSARPAIPCDFHLADEASFAFAGLCDRWTDPATGEVRDTFAIVTTAPLPAVAKIHDRMPLVLPDRIAMSPWLNMKNIVIDSLPLTVGPASFARENRQLELL
jgi:putative SOS response-associated peptidase YedK